MNILVRADSSFTIGTGHIMRDLVLAKQYQDDTIIFATRDLAGNINHQITQQHYAIHNLATNNLAELIKVINQYTIDMVIIDHYDIDYEFERSLKEKTGITIFALDDTYEKHHCDILLNHNVSAKPDKYVNLVPSHCILRCGSKYTLLRDEFIAIKQSKFKHKKNQIKYILIAMGGADVSGIIPQIIKAIRLTKYKNIQILATTANKNLQYLMRIAKYNKHITIHINSPKVAQVISMAELVILSPSVILNEVIFLNIPYIAIKTADNQKDIFEYVSKHKAVALESMNLIKLRNILHRSYENSDSRWH